MSTLSMHIVTYLIEYLGVFEFIFENILDYESGDQMGSFDAKKPPSKISCLGTFKQVRYKVFLKPNLSSSQLIKTNGIWPKPSETMNMVINIRYSCIDVWTICYLHIYFSDSFLSLPKSKKIDVARKPERAKVFFGSVYCRFRE